MKKKDTLFCPCCKTEVYKSNLKNLLKSGYSINQNKIKLDYEFLHNFNNWVCDTCFESGRAILGNPSKQKFIDYYPYFFYYDVEKTCERCDQSFVFSKKEQLYWYEELQFWVQSKAIHCPDCRKIIRQQKANNKELSELLAQTNQLDKTQIERLIEIYTELEKPEKVNYYKNLKQRKFNL
ncbi:MAG: hypothetical protein CMO01_05050 [Thalassobius sp.]|nr:hypothetical protein [Thalassovita sp.]